MALKFNLIATDGNARRGSVETAHGTFQTPAFMAVGTAATVKALTMDQVAATGTEVILGNTYHLMMRPGGDLVEQMKDKVESLGLEESVLFLGGTTRVHEYMQAMDIFLLPSSFEGFGIVGIEAQATGLPCIFSDVISKEVALTENCEYVSLAANVDIWVEKIIYFRNSSKKRSSNTKVLEEAGFSNTVYPTFLNKIWHLDE